MIRLDNLSEIERAHIRDLVRATLENTEPDAQNLSANYSLSSFLEGVVAGFKFAVQLQHDCSPK